ncbi:LCP family protein [Geodermatophilus sp. DSM 44513]|uniref:LCP family protein n=1 Tax=Geodermatophilus sp. DSM 44513 TaxID=1528104 RepID=UPI0028F6E9DF|nr:LCP family protein [Geodermatophilus sp. DSM 44513]WNV74793.1 LCP family protein [Geodermatophilus sp. DSM 44513]
MSDEPDKGPRPGGRPLPARLDPRSGRPPRRRPAAEPSRAAPDRYDAAPPGAGRGHRVAAAARAVAAVLAVVVLGASGWGWYLGQVADATVNRTDAIPADGNTGSGQDMNLLLVGNDSRAQLTDQQMAELTAGADSGINTDTMILVHVPADGSRASFVSFPRDSYVEIPGYGMDKLNAAYAYGYGEVDDAASEAAKQAAGGQLLVQTLSRLTGLQIDHYAEVDLLGFFELSSVVGGVEVNLCEAVDDSEFSGAVFAAGPQTISGADALAFVRQRHGLPRGDLDRIVRQQVFMGGVLRKILSEQVLLDLGKQRQLVEAASQSLTIDRDLVLLDLAQQMQAVTAGAIEFQTVPVVGDDRDEQGRAILRLADADTLRDFFAELSAAPAGPAAPVAPAAPSAVTVDVQNGSGVAGVAAEAATALEAAGFAVGSTGNADASDYGQTVVRHAVGDERLAAALAAAVPGALVEADTEATPGTVQLVLGSDFTAVGQALAPVAPSAPVETDAARTAADTGCIY